MEDKYGSNSKCCLLKEHLINIKSKLVDMYKEGYEQRVIISRNDNIIADIPLTAVVISSFVLLVYPILSLMNLGGALLFNIKFKLIDRSGKVHDLNSDVKNRVSKVVSNSKEKLNDIFSNVDIKFTADEIKNRATEFGKKTMENFNDLIEKKIIKNVDNNNIVYSKFVYESEEDESEKDESNETIQLNDLEL